LALKNYPWKKYVTIFSGTALSQILPIFTTIVLVRSITPSEFGIYSTWLGVVLIISSVITGRYEMAIVLEADGDARRNAQIATLIVIVISGIFLLIGTSIVILINPMPLQIISTKEILLITPSAILVASSQVWLLSASGDGRYRDLTRIRLVQAFLIGSIQVCVGLIYKSGYSLCIAYFSGYLLLLNILIFRYPIKLILNKQEIKIFWKNYWRYPIFSLATTSMSNIAGQAPLIIIGSRYGSEMAGYFALGGKVLGAPMALLGSVILDVFRRTAVIGYKLRGDCRVEYIQAFKLLCLVSVMLSISMYFFAEKLSVVFFGDSWSGSIATLIILIPIYTIKLVASPLSFTFDIAKKNHIEFIWQLIMVMAIFYIFSVKNDYNESLILYSFTISILYIIYIVYSYKFSKLK